MYARLGIHWASSIPAFLALACVPFPFLFYKYGKQIRMKCKYAAESEAFMHKIRGQQQPEEEEERSEETSTESDDEDKEKEDFEEKKDKVQRARNAARMEREAEEEREAIDYSYEEPDLEHGGTAAPRFERIKTATQGPQDYDYNPYDIDRVNTRDSFGRSRSRSATGSSLRKTKSGKSGRSFRR
jgi:hypothetical protein